MGKTNLNTLYILIISIVVVVIVIISVTIIIIVIPACFFYTEPPAVPLSNKILYFK